MNHPGKWSQSEIDYVLSARNRGDTVAMIANFLDRSEKSVEARIRVEKYRRMEVENECH